MLHRLKSAARRNRTIYRTTRSLADSLKPVIDFSVTNFGSRRGRKFRRTADYFRPTSAAGYIGWVGNGNLGDEALFDAFQQLFPNHTPLLYDRHPVELGLHQRLVKRESPFFDFVALGGGTLFSYRPYYYMVDHAIAHNRPLLTFGTGVEDPAFFTNAAQRTEYESLLRDWAKLLANQTNVYVRGPHTAAVLAQFGLPHAKVIGDPALTLCRPTPRATHRRVGINLGCDGKMFGDQITLTESVVAAAKYLLDLGYSIDFIAMEPLDFRLGLEFAKAVDHPRVSVSRCDKTPRAVLDRFAACDLVIGQRLHAVILAAGLGVPTIALEYRPKVADFMASVDLLNYSLRTSDATPDRIIALVDDALVHRDRIHTHLVARCDHFRQLQASAAYAMLAQLEHHAAAANSLPAAC
jgi:polysaccharide pyruvyl transferase WcaK-like protein